MNNLKELDKVFAQNTIKIVKKQIEGMDNLIFHKYWLDFFIVKNKQIGKDIQDILNCHNDLDKLQSKILSYE